MLAKQHNYSNGLTVIVGLGITGLACIRYLTAQNVNVAVIDSRNIPPGFTEFLEEFPTIPYTVGTFKSAYLDQAERIIISPGISLQEPEIAAQITRGIPVIGDIELFAEVAKAPVVAITGSNGKTTVTTLVGKMIAAAGLRVGVGGNIGEPALNLLSHPADFYVLELSSFQLETTYSLRTVAAVILNITPDHMDRYPNYAAYCNAKQRIYHRCQQPIVPIEQPDIWQDLELPAQPITFGLSDQADFRLGQYQQEDYLLYQDQPLIAVAELPLHHPHHLLNALAALALGASIGLPNAAMLNILREFTGLPHRCQLVGIYLGVSWYNDSKGTNVGATIAAINSLGAHKKGRLILIVGGDSKQADLSSLLRPISQFADELILLGRDAPLFYQLLNGHISCTTVSSMAEAVATAQHLTQPKDIVLLSPACASFDMFDNYMHRGEVFAQCVQAIHS